VVRARCAGDKIANRSRGVDGLCHATELRKH
jgi:hypothetical protein